MKNMETENRRCFGTPVFLFVKSSVLKRFLAGFPLFNLAKAASVCYDNHMYDTFRIFAETEDKKG